MRLCVSVFSSQIISPPFLPPPLPSFFLFSSSFSSLLVSSIPLNLALSSATCFFHPASSCLPMLLPSSHPSISFSLRNLCFPSSSHPASSVLPATPRPPLSSYHFLLLSSCSSFSLFIPPFSFPSPRPPLTFAVIDPSVALLQFSVGGFDFLSESLHICCRTPHKQPWPLELPDTQPVHVFVCACASVCLCVCVDVFLWLTPCHFSI